MKNNRITQRADCQVLRLPTERRRSNSRGSLRIVSGLAENTHSIFCDGPQGSETVNGCPVLREQEPSPRGTRASCGFCQSSPCALLRSAPQENFFSLTKTYMDVGNPYSIGITEELPVIHPKSRFDAGNPLSTRSKSIPAAIPLALLHQSVYLLVEGIGEPDAIWIH